ncbi:MAG: 5-deoxy-glucuronate isomerase [Thermoleophilia bacterium]|nr:5-deoxy-glucuronate isomerase [Thermoleophilia bacterium]
MKYHAHLSHDQDLNSLPTNPCALLDFQMLILSNGNEFTGNSGDREILAVILGGKASFSVNGSDLGMVGERPNVFSGKPYSVYIPAGAEYSIKAAASVDIALPSAPSDLAIAPYVIGPDKVANGVWGAANFKRYFHQILTTAAQPDFPARRLIVGETFTPSGNWSTYPPHKHQLENLPVEAFHEEMYYFKVNPTDGFGICHYYNEEGEEENFTVRDNTIHMMDKGYHTVVSAPGYTTYYLWFLAGNQRQQATVEDADLGWVSRTVPMLRELGF